MSFFVETNGALTDPKVERGLGHGCDEEAIRMVQSMPNWEPVKNKPKRVNVAIPIRFGEKIKKEGE